MFRVYRDFPTALTHDYEDELGERADFRRGLHSLHRRRDPTEFGVFGRESRVYATPPRVVGEAVVLYTEANTATARLTATDREVYVGDHIVYEPVDTGVASVATFTAPAEMQPNVPLSRQPARPAPVPQPPPRATRSRSLLRPGG